MKTKILFVIAQLAVGGAEKFLVSLANALDPELFESLIISLSDKNDLLSDLNNNIRFIALPRKKKIDRKTFLTLRKILKQEKPDIIFNVGAYSFFVVNIASLFSPSLKNIISYHTTVHVDRKQHLLHKLYFAMVKKKDKIITVSKNQENYTADTYNINRDLLMTIHNGIDINKWKLPVPDFDRSKYRQKYNMPVDAKVIVIAAVLRPEKNHLEAIKALKMLHDLYETKAYLLIVGDGIMRNDLTILTEKLSLIEYIKFTGKQEDVRPFYWMSDLFTLCSDSETFSLAALEAMGCGLPAVITKVGGASEIIIENKNGFLCLPNEVDISDKWNQAFKFSFDKKTISHHIHQKFNHTDMVREYINVFKSI